MDTKILKSMFIIGLLALALGLGTYSYFSDVGTSSDNTFSSGTMDLRLDGLNGVTATWASPSNWSPGKNVTGEIILSNVGSVYALNLRFDFKNLVTTDGGSDGSNLATKVYITDWDFRKDGIWTSGPGNWYMSVFDTSGDGNLSLYELTTVSWANPLFWACDKSDLTLIDDKDSSGDITTGDIVETPAGAPDTKGVIGYWDGIRMTFEFASDAGNEYQGDTASFELEVKIFNDAATQVTYGGEGCGHGYQ